MNPSGELKKTSGADITTATDVAPGARLPSEKRVAVVQFSVQFGEPAKNFQGVDQLLSSHGHLDLIVLPELAFTGYDFHTREELSPLAERYGYGPTTDFLSHLSQRHRAVVVAGYAEADGAKIYNSAVAVSNGSVLGNYRKLHLFSRENELFSPGDAAPVAIDTPAGRIGMMICFDWFFPETARLLALDGAQILAHPSNLVLPWCQQAMFARSVENHVFSITANRVGTESRAGQNLRFTGGSQILSPAGVPLAAASSEEEAVITAVICPRAADDKQLNPYNHLVTSRRSDIYDLSAISATSLSGSASR